MSKILVTGGAGFIGSNLVDALIRLNNQVVVIDNLSSGKKEYLNPQAKFYQADICSAEADKILNSESEIEKIDYVFHLAAQIDVRVSVADPIYDNKINVFGGFNILEGCRRYGIKKIVFSSTGGAVYGDAEEIPTSESYLPEPISPYGIHKLTFEKYLNYYDKVYGQDYLALRFANIYGPRQYKGGEAGVIAIFTEKAVNNQICLINGDGKQTRDYVYVADAVNAFIKAGQSDYRGEINIGTRKETDLLEIIEAIEAAIGGKVLSEHGPGKAGEQRRSCLTNDLAKKILDWQPEVDLTEGIRRTIEWSMEQKKNLI